LSTRYCSTCGSALAEDALYCHKCGKGIQDGSPARAGEPKDNFKLGLLLIRIGAALSALLPLLALVGITAFSGGAFSGYMPGMFVGILAVIFGMGALFAAITLKFHNDIARGNKERIIHTIILAIAMFFLGSNVAGIVSASGHFCAILRQEKWLLPRSNYSFKRRAICFAWYVIIMSAPALLMPVKNSAITAFSSIHPSIAAAFISAYSPDTL
jgi:hypothetical protein